MRTSVERSYIESRIKDYLFAGVVRAFKVATTKGGDPSGSKEG